MYRGSKRYHNSGAVASCGSIIYRVHAVSCHHAQPQMMSSCLDRPRAYPWCPDPLQRAVFCTGFPSPYCSPDTKQQDPSCRSPGLLSAAKTSQITHRQRHLGCLVTRSDQRSQLGQSSLGETTKEGRLGPLEIAGDHVAVGLCIRDTRWQQRTQGSREMHSAFPCPEQAASLQKGLHSRGLPISGTHSVL